MGRETKYETKVNESEKEWNITNSAGQCTNSIQKNGGETVINKPNGMKAITTTQADSRFGDNSPFTSNVKAIFPSGKETEISFTQNIELEDPNNATSVKKIITETTINGTRKVKREYDNILKTFVVTSPLNKQSKSTFDEFGRVIKEENPGFYAVNYTYDEFGMLKTMSQGSGNEERKATFYYDEKERLVKIEDNSGDNEQYFYDEKGRLYKTILPNGKEVIEDFDKNNNTTKITLPNEEQHKFEYTSIDRLASYEAPNETITSYDYNLDGQMTQITEPINEEVIYNYNSSSGVLESIVYPDTTINYVYNDVTGNITSVSKGNETLAYTYDGGLLLSEESAGNINGLVEYNYDNDLRISSVKVNDISINYSFNDDNELLSVNDLTITNDETTGFMKETNIDNIKEKYEYNQFGEVKKYEVFYSNNLIYSESYDYNTKGFIEVKTVVDGANTNTFNYIYDKIGQLTEIKKNNSTIESYSYDSNGNRLNNNAQYDSQDRLISNSSTTFGYTERGTLLTRTENNQITSYNYDLMGNLLSVTLPNSTEIEYITDARNRRTAKKVNGVVTQKFLYLNQLEPIAELDANDNIISLFVYGTRSNTPDYIVKNNVKYKVVTNQLGSVVKVVNTTNGTIEQAIEYDSFGNILSDSNPNFQPFTLTGGLYDNDTKLTRFGARDYDARDGRWTTKDPIKFDGGINFYVYAGNNPVNYVDLDGRNPTGLKSINQGYLKKLDEIAIKRLSSLICKGIKNKKEYGQEYVEKHGKDQWDYLREADTTTSSSDEVALYVDDSTILIVHVHVFCGDIGNTRYFSEEFSSGDKATNAKVSYIGTVMGNVHRLTKDGTNTVIDMNIGKLDLSKCSCGQKAIDANIDKNSSWCK